MSWWRLSAAAALVGAAAAAAALAFGGPDPARAAGLPACVHARGRLALPAPLGQFPLPAGAVIERRQLKYGYAIYSGYVPGAINPVRDFLVARLPAAGYRLGAGDAETAEAEAAYSGHALHGRWKVRAVPGCPGALTIQIAVRASP
jgi:hypothetical protein